MRRRKGEERVHVGRAAGQVDGKNGSGARREGGPQPRRVKVVVLAHVHEDRPGLDQADCAGRGHERVRNGDNLVTRTDTEHLQGEDQRIGAGLDSHRLAGPAQSRYLRLQLAHLRAEHEMGMTQNLVHGLQQLRAQGLMLCCEVHIGDGQIHWCFASSYMVRMSS